MPSFPTRPVEQHPGDQRAAVWTNIILITVTTVITIIITIAAGQAWSMVAAAAFNHAATRGMYVYATSATLAAIVICVAFAVLASELDVHRYMQKRNPLVGTTLVPVYKDDNKTIKGYVVTGQEYAAEDTAKTFNPVVDTSAYFLFQ